MWGIFIKPTQSIYPADIFFRFVYKINIQRLRKGEYLGTRNNSETPENQSIVTIST